MNLSQQMAAITSDSDESCCSLTVSDRPLWIQTGSIEVNSETGSTKTLAGCWFHGPVTTVTENSRASGLNEIGDSDF